MTLRSKFQLSIECNPKVGSRNCQFHQTRGIEFQIGMPLYIISHSQKHHCQLREETRVLLSETHCNFCNGGLNVVNQMTREYTWPGHFSHSQLHLKLTNLKSTSSLWVQDSRAIIARVLKWLQEVSFNSPQNDTQDLDQGTISFIGLVESNYSQGYPYPICPMVKSIILTERKKSGFFSMRHIAIL